MSRLIAITLSSLILIQSLHIGVEDILQLDELIEHAQFHKQEHGDSFLVFLSKHYGELKAEHSKNHQEEQKDHEQLPPFQWQSYSSTIIAFLPNSVIPYTNGFDVLDTSEEHFHYLNFYSFRHKKERFQPPRHA